MKKSVCVATLSLSLGALAPSAFAADTVIKGSLTETLEGSDNYFLSPTPPGTTFKSLSTLNLDVLARTPGWRYLLSSNVSYFNYFGPGADVANPTHGTPINERFQIDHVTELARYNLFASWSRLDVAATQLRESGQVTSSGTIDTAKTGGGVSYDLSRIDSVSWNAQALRTSFTNSTQTPFNDYSTSVIWNRQFSSTTSFNTSVNFDWFDADDIAKSQRLFWQIMTGVKSQLTRRLTVNGSVGIDFANAWQDNPMPVPVGGATTSQSGAAKSWIALGGATYQLFKPTSVSVYAAHLIVPTTLGQLQKTDTASISLIHNINFWSTVSLSANFAHISARTSSLFTGTNSDFFSTQVAYSYRLSRDWTARTSYSFRQRNDDFGSARANVFLVSLRYDFNPLGNPAALEPVEIERTLLRQQRAIGEVFPTLQ